MSKGTDLTGRVFGQLTVTGYSHTDRNSYWCCKCACGKTTVTQRAHLMSGATKSCGCGRNSHRIRHNMSGTRAYSIWVGMVQRCGNPNDPSYHNYGGRGIVVCDQWKQFINFFDHMGHPPDKYTIDRIDNERGYEPGNCRWATRKEQAQNKRKAEVFRLRDQLATQAEQLRIAREALDEYANHSDGCAALLIQFEYVTTCTTLVGKCDCGYDEVIASIDNAEVG